VRIVGGQAKGRRLTAPASATRPTSDRAREALFNSLTGSFDLEGARVLDLFAGTGAVGLEALSRGAVQAVFVESNRGALAVLRRNIEAVGLPGARVVGRPVTAYLAGEPEQPFDLVIADPPYELDTAKIIDVLDALARPEWLAAGAFVVVERSARTAASPWPDGLITPVRERRYGEGVLWYGRRR
jgi:16S rRNA (guanine966-N2)-methyltransferase